MKAEMEDESKIRSRYAYTIICNEMEWKMTLIEPDN